MNKELAEMVRGARIAAVCKLIDVQSPTRLLSETRSTAALAALLVDVFEACSATDAGVVLTRANPP